MSRIYEGHATEAAFLLGGIGTGNVSIGARGEFRDWEIFNNQGKGNQLPYTFFALWGREQGKAPFARVIQSRLQPPYSKSHGMHYAEMGGLPRFQRSTMRGEYPYAWLEFEDDVLPVEVSLEAYTPFIPLEEADSGIPCAVMTYKVKNTSTLPMDVTVMGSLANASGFNGYNRWENLKEQLFEGNVNEYKTESAYRGLYMDSTTTPHEHVRYGNMAMITTHDKVTVKPHWRHVGWIDSLQDIWNDFSQDGRLEPEVTLSESHLKVGSLGAYETLAPREERSFTFVLTWYFPNRLKGWFTNYYGDPEKRGISKNYYTTRYRDAWDVADYVVSHLDRLSKGTKDFHHALFSSSLPPEVLDAAASNLTVMRSTTCFWLDDGKFYGWEGGFDQAGCCEGNCTHVWNYAQSIAFLFPRLEQDMRITEFNIETEADGRMHFRGNQSFGEPFPYEMLPAVDGQLGTIMRLYRDYKLSGDLDFLRSVWDNVKKALDFAFTYWDKDGDLVIDGQQHNTYDIEFYGPNSLSGSLFYGALRAAARMAEDVGDVENAQRYEEAGRLGAERMDDMLWNGEYYEQLLEDINAYKHQYGKGCLSDQLFGQLLAHVSGLGYILPEEHVKTALQSVYRYNFRSDFTGHTNVQRTYALYEEQGLLMCSWPKGGRPKLPFVYSDEVWTGVEYQVAAHLIYEGFLYEGLTIVKAVRDRHDGVKRNPWNEVECGHHYVRSMASWALLTAYSGYRCDLAQGVIEFHPAVADEDFICFFSCGRAWGQFSRKYDESSGQFRCEIHTLYGSLEGIRIKVYDEEIVA